MKKHLITTLAAAGMTVAAAAPALAGDVSLRAVRVDAVDVQAAADFYEAAFGLHEIRRLGGEDAAFMEIIMNFGETAEEAAANTAPPFVILSRPDGAEASPVANAIFQVDDIEAAIAHFVELGGTAVSEPALSGALTYAFVLDPEGNRIELLSE
ncbi:MAG: VOC family protein [Maricaulaceae bacterium]|jgi:predicted enzyme related to lactoylglutathione lyase